MIHDSLEQHAHPTEHFYVNFVTEPIYPFQNKKNLKLLSYSCLHLYDLMHIFQ